MSRLDGALYDLGIGVVRNPDSPTWVFVNPAKEAIKEVFLELVSESVNTANSGSQAVEILIRKIEAEL